MQALNAIRLLNLEAYRQIVRLQGLGVESKAIPASDRVQAMTLPWEKWQQDQSLGFGTRAGGREMLKSLCLSPALRFAAE
jgi:hypothetical protein